MNIRLGVFLMIEFIKVVPDIILKVNRLSCNLIRIDYFY